MTKAEAIAFIKRVDQHLDRIEDEIQQQRVLGCVEDHPSRADMAIGNLALARSNAMLLLGIEE